MKRQNIRFSIPIFIIALLMITGSFVLLSGTSEAREKRLSSKKSYFLKLAATEYWGSRGNLTGVPCQPFDVSINYSNTYNVPQEWVAFATLWGAYPSGTNLPAAGGIISHTGGEYCSVKFVGAVYESSRESCVTFLHEYGHLIGLDHNNTITSPMYDGYIKGDGTFSERLYNRHNKLVLARSACRNLRQP